MNMCVISAQPLNVDPSDYRFLGVASGGKDKGKHVYINTRWTVENANSIFDGEQLEVSLTLLQREVLTSDNLFETLSQWYDPTSILVLNPEETQEFNEYYEMLGDADIINLLLGYEYDEMATVAKVILMNEMDVLINMSRRTGLGGE